MRRLFGALKRRVPAAEPTRGQSPDQLGRGEPEPVSEAVMDRWEEKLWELECEIEDMQAELAECEGEHPPWEDVEQQLASGVYPKSGRKIPESQLAKKRELVQTMKRHHAELPTLIKAERERFEELQRRVEETPVHYEDTDDAIEDEDWEGYRFSSAIDFETGLAFESSPLPSPLSAQEQGRPTPDAAPKRRKRTGQERFAVIDTETTGFSKQDRVVEFACVTVVGGEVVDEYDTLIQPNRDPGAVHVHGITPAMLQAAPRFEQVLPDIAERLDGAVLVAHNISFDVRMLSQEVDRIAGATFSAGNGICTYKITGSKLGVAARDAGLGSQKHTALGDARLVAGLLALHGTMASLPASCTSPTSASGFTMRRPGSPQRTGSLHQLAMRSDWPKGTGEAEALYLDVLDRTLDDGLLEPWEITWLNETAFAVGISETGREDLHAKYYDKLVEQIRADGIVTAEEASLSRMVAGALGVEPQAHTPTPQSEQIVVLEPGLKVCFTGQAAVGRAELEKIAVAVGAEPIPTVTKKCGLLVAADPLSQSGKAKKAREYGIPVIGAEEFLSLATKASGL